MSVTNSVRDGLLEARQLREATIEAKKQRALKLIAEGCTTTHIARRLHLDRERVNEWRRAAGAA
jgi:DNA-binding CsgD family transcriptional regulator